MRVKLSTKIVDIIVPDTYGTEFCYNVIEDMWDDFKNLMVQKAEPYIKDALKETIFKDAELSDFSFHSPREYNFETDWIEFTMEFDDKLIDEIRQKVDDDFFKYIKKYESRSGFISFMPTTKEKYFESLDKGIQKYGYGFERAISEWIMYEVEKEFDLDEYQRDYLEDVWEYASSNGYEEYDYDEQN